MTSQCTGDIHSPDHHSSGELYPKEIYSQDSAIQLDCMFTRRKHDQLVHRRYSFSRPPLKWRIVPERDLTLRIVLYNQIACSRGEKHDQLVHRRDPFSRQQFEWRIVPERDITLRIVLAIRPASAQEIYVLQIITRVENCTRKRFNSQDNTWPVKFKDNWPHKLVV